MNNDVKIPWDAIIYGGAESQVKALPLVFSTHYQSRSWCFPCLPLSMLIPDSLSKPMAMIRQSSSSTMLELSILSSSQTAMLTSDGDSSVVIQATWEVPGCAHLPNRELRRAARARLYVARHAKFDADARAFVLPPTPGAADADDDDVDPQPQLRFFRPHVWGFSKTPQGLTWTADELFQPSLPGKPTSTHFAFARPRFHEPFTEPAATPADRGDPFRCLPQLRQFRIECHQLLDEMAQPDVDPRMRPHHEHRIRELAHALALGLGRCRLFGVVPNADDDFTLSPQAFEIGTGHLIEKLQEAAMRVEEIAKDPGAVVGYAACEIALQFLEIRMDAHAASLAFDEAYAAARYEGAPEADVMGDRNDKLRRLIDRLDGNLQNQIPLLRLAASTRLLENWRRLLAPAHCDLPPWWLDGCLEEASLA